MNDGLDALKLPVPPAVIKGPSGVTYQGRSFCMRPATKPRQNAIYLVEAKWFEPIVLTVSAKCSVQCSVLGRGPVEHVLLGG